MGNYCRIWSYITTVRAWLINVAITSVRKFGYNFASYYLVVNMSPQKQIFQTSSRLRGNTFKWAGRLLLFFLLLMIPVVWIAMANVNSIFLPGLSRLSNKKSNNAPAAKSFNKKEKRKYHGFEDYLKVKHQNSVIGSGGKGKKKA